MVGHIGMAHRAQIDGVVEPQPVEPVLGHHPPGLGIALAAPVELAPAQLEAMGAGRLFHRRDPLGHDLVPDAVAGDHRHPIALCHANFLDRSLFYLSVFQMSVASSQREPTLRHTTTYLPTTCFGGWALVSRVTVPISRAERRPSRCTSTVTSLASPTCRAVSFQKASI